NIRSGEETLLIDGKLELSEIPATSPTLAEAMRSCLLRAGLSRASRSSCFVLGSPKGWLGSAYHKVLERIPTIDLGRETLDSAVERLGQAAIAAQHRRAKDHPLDRRFGTPATWAGYHLARASVQLRAHQLVGDLLDVISAALDPGSTKGLA